MLAEVMGAEFKRNKFNVLSMKNNTDPCSASLSRLHCSTTEVLFICNPEDTVK